MEQDEGPVANGFRVVCKCGHIASRVWVLANGGRWFYCCGKGDSCDALAFEETFFFNISRPHPQSQRVLSPLSTPVASTRSTLNTVLHLHGTNTPSNRDGSNVEFPTFHGHEFSSTLGTPVTSVGSTFHASSNLHNTNPNTPSDGRDESNIEFFHDPDNPFNISGSLAANSSYSTSSQNEKPPDQQLSPTASQETESVGLGCIPKPVHKKRMGIINARHRDDMKILRQHYAHTRRAEQRKINRLNTTVAELKYEIEEQRNRLLHALEAQNDLYRRYGSEA